MLDGPQERLCLRARRHGAVLARPFARSLALAALGAALLLLPPPFPAGGAIVLAAGAVLAIRSVWRWDQTILVVTTEKLVVASGTMRRRAASVSLRSVDAVELEQSFAGRLLGYGTLVVGPLEISHVPEPRRVYRLVERLAE